MVRSDRHYRGALMLIPVAVGTLGILLGVLPDLRSSDQLPTPTPLRYHSDNWQQRLGYDIPAAKYQGTGSCASMGCHNADGLIGQAGSEHATWVRHDPHSRAYSVLFEDRSKRMVGQVRQLDDWRQVKAHEDALCLKCHSVDPPIEQQDRPPNRAYHVDGVGCEACHGPAERYLSAHYQSWWHGLSRQQKANQYGLYPTDDLAFRGMLCAKCHVGNSEQEVDHQLIAAGHPALRFEYTAYHHHPKYTRHWTEKDYGPDFEVRAWLIGLIASTRSSVELLHARAERKEGDWPELAEYNCFSCHHELESPSWRQQQGRREPLGFMAWNTWHDPITRAAADELGRVESGIESSSLESLLELRKLMENPKSRRADVVAQSERTLRDLDVLMAELQRRADTNSRRSPYSATDVQDLLGRFVSRAEQQSTQPPGGWEWDRATQHWLAIAALYHGLTDVSPVSSAPAYRRAIEKARGPITFPDGYDQPKDRFTPERYRQRIERIDELRKQLGPWE